MTPRRLTRLSCSLAALLLVASHTNAVSILDYRARSDDWFRTEDAKVILANVLARQTTTGGWWKDYDPAEPVEPSTPALRDGRSIFDNGATTTEVRLLARAFRLTGDVRYRDAAKRAVELILTSQYANGGWPQEYPVPSKGYAGQITFNDEAMVRILQLLKEVAEQPPDFAFLGEATRTKARQSFDRGIDCILACQIRVKGELTVWCAQHDPVTLAPAQARSYELPSLSGGESAGILLLLMSIDNPSDRVKESIRAGVSWYDRAALRGIRLQTKANPTDAKRRDYDVVPDPNAAPLWARFYDLETGKPFYCDRDGVKKSSIDQIGAERRVGYAWLRPWGAPVLARYAEWVREAR